MAAVKEVSIDAAVSLLKAFSMDNMFSLHVMKSWGWDDRMGRLEL